MRDRDLRRVPPASSDYWVRVRALALQVGSDGCTLVPDFYLDACYEHDIHWRTGFTIDGQRISVRQANMRFRRVIQSRSPFGILSPMSWWRYWAVTLSGIFLAGGRMKKILIAALLMGLAGCATAAPPKGLSTAFDCAPEGYESFEGWTLTEARVGMATSTDDGRPQAIAIMFLARAGRSVMLGIIDSHLALVDANPDDPGVPMLVSRRYFNDAGQVRSAPGGPCEWRELLNSEPAACPHEMTRR